MQGWGWGHYKTKTVKALKKDVEAVSKKMTKKGAELNPIKIEGKKIVNSFWGRAWCDQIELSSDYENRLPRGRSYVRSGAVINLDIKKAEIDALVYGSSLYNVKVRIKTLNEKKWQKILEKSSGEISSVIELLQGKLSSSVMKIMTDPLDGILPTEKEISFTCSCFDVANMCKHVAAVLYGVGARLDNKPELLFLLRNVDYNDLAGKIKLNKKSTKSKIIQNKNLSEIFGIDIEDGVNVGVKAISRGKGKGGLK